MWRKMNWDFNVPKLGLGNEEKKIRAFVAKYLLPQIHE
jgi:hypothetical protein